MSQTRIRVQVVHALPERHWQFDVELPEGASVADALRESGIAQRLPDVEIAADRIGVFGRLVGLDAPLHDGDRVEIYRPLLCDPKEVRRRRAREQAAG